MQLFTTYWLLLLMLMFRQLGPAYLQLQGTADLPLIGCSYWYWCFVNSVLPTCNCMEKLISFRSVDICGVSLLLRALITSYDSNMRFLMFWYDNAKIYYVSCRISKFVSLNTNCSNCCISKIMFLTQYKNFKQKCVRTFIKFKKIVKCFKVFMFLKQFFIANQLKDYFVW